MSKMKMLFGIPYMKYNLPLIYEIQDLLEENEISFKVKEVEVDAQETHLHFFVKEDQCKKAKKIIQER